MRFVLHLLLAAGAAFGQNNQGEGAAATDGTTKEEKGISIESFKGGVTAEFLTDKGESEFRLGLKLPDMPKKFDPAKEIVAELHTIGGFGGGVHSWFVRCDDSPDVLYWEKKEGKFHERRPASPAGLQQSIQALHGLVRGVVAPGPQRTAHKYLGAMDGVDAVLMVHYPDAARQDVMIVMRGYPEGKTDRWSDTLTQFLVSMAERRKVEMTIDSFGAGVTGGFLNPESDAAMRKGLKLPGMPAELDPDKNVIAELHIVGGFIDGVNSFFVNCDDPAMVYGWTGKDKEFRALKVGTKRLTTALATMKVFMGRVIAPGKVWTSRTYLIGGDIPNVVLALHFPGDKKPDVAVVMRGKPKEKGEAWYDILNELMVAITDYQSSEGTPTAPR